jgi:hypothetical protein
MQIPPQHVDDDVQVVPVPVQHVLAVVGKPVTGRQVAFDGLHAVPAAQHFIVAPVPHGVRPFGHPQIELTRSTHATPAMQQALLQGVWPLRQQQFFLALVHAPPAWQQFVPHTRVPDGQAASARKGLRTTAATPPAAAAPIPLSTLRRLVARPIRRVRSSNLSPLTGRPSAGVETPPAYTSGAPHTRPPTPPLTATPGISSPG